MQYKKNHLRGDNMGEKLVVCGIAGKFDIDYSMCHLY